MARTSRLEQGAGAAAGAGGTLALYQFVDEPGMDLPVQPSVMYGVGSGAIAGVLWWLNQSGRFRTPVVGSGFWAAHALSGIATGAAAFAFPKGQDESTILQQSGQTTSMRQSRQPAPTRGQTPQLTERNRQRGRSRNRR